MRRLALVIAFMLGAIGFAFAQAPAADEHSAHHPAQDTAPTSQSSPAQSDAKSGPAAQSTLQPGQAGGAMDGPPMRGMMQGMMQMMQGMQGMMGKMHQQTQAEQKQPARMQTMQDCPMMPRTGAATGDAATMQAMMQMMQGMMQMMQSQMQSGQAQRQ